MFFQIKCHGKDHKGIQKKLRHKEKERKGKKEKKNIRKREKWRGGEGNQGSRK